MNLSIVRRSALVVVAASTTVFPGIARAQDAPRPPTTTPETSPQANGPNVWLVGGITTFAFAYLPAVTVGATSAVGADRALYVPIAGPWIDFGRRPACPPLAPCSENSAREMLGIDGVIQAIGVLGVVQGFVDIARETAVARRSATLRPAAHVSPAQIGTGHGVVAWGSF